MEIAGNGTEKPNVENAWPTLPKLMPPIGAPNSVLPHAMTVPTAMATRPAGMPFQ